MSFWDTVADLRRIEFIAILITMIVPLLSGTLILKIRHRIKTLQTLTSQNQGSTYQENIHGLGAENNRLSKELTSAHNELIMLRRINAPRHMTELQEQILIGQLRGVQAAPVIVAAYAFEDESAAYAAQIAAALRKANWTVTLIKASMNDFKGVSLGTVNEMRRPMTGQHELAQALTAAHVELHQHEISPDSIAGPLQDGSLLVVVGRK